MIEPEPTCFERLMQIATTGALLVLLVIVVL